MFFSSKEYKVALKGRSGVLYTEGKRKAQIEAEMMTGPTDLIIYFDQFRSWQPPFEQEDLSDEDRQRIKLNISKELEDKGLKIGLLSRICGSMWAGITDFLRISAPI